MARTAAPKHRSTAAMDPSLYLREPADAKVDGCHTPIPHPTNPRTRRRAEQRPPPPQESSQPRANRRKINHPTGSRPPAAFWDNLSKSWLTKLALKELDQRNTRPAASSPSRRPVTRLAVGQWKNNEENQPAAAFLTHGSAGRWEDIKRLAQHGGPDLSGPRGVRIARCYLLELALIGHL